ETAAIRLESRSYSDLLILGALREEPAVAIKTDAAGNVVKTHNAVANGPSFNMGAGLHDCPGYLMTQYLRRFNWALSPLLCVGSTDPACFDLDENLAIRSLGNCNVFGYDSSRTAIHAGTHHRRHRKRPRWGSSVRFRVVHLVSARATKNSTRALIKSLM